MVSIKWCLKTKNGIELVEPSNNLADAYIKKAEESLGLMRTTEYRDWKISIAYYSMYYSLYAILMKIGIKCEIHACTIELMKEFLPDYFSKEEYEFMLKAMGARIDVQYYVNKEVKDKLYGELTKKPVDFLVKCKSILHKLNEDKINEIRSRIKKLK